MIVNSTSKDRHRNQTNATMGTKEKSVQMSEGELANGKWKSKKNIKRFPAAEGDRS